jgi:light-regulated signal transduction histidine kinase (bacteriophytochrome)
VVEQYARRISPESIHMLGRVQPHGFVLVVDMQTEVVVQATCGVVRHLPSLRSVDHVLATAVEEWVLPPPRRSKQIAAGLARRILKD